MDKIHPNDAMMCTEDFYGYKVWRDFIEWHCICIDYDDGSLPEGRFIGFYATRGWDGWGGLPLTIMSKQFVQGLYAVIQKEKLMEVSCDISDVNLAVNFFIF